MSIDAVAAVAGPGLHDEVALPALQTPVPAGGTPFAGALARNLEAVNGQLLASQSDLQALALGETRNLHDLMVRLEEGRIAFQFLLQARNRVLEAYQDVMRMQL